MIPSHNPQSDPSPAIRQRRWGPIIVALVAFFLLLDACLLIWWLSSTKHPVSDSVAPVPPKTFTLALPQSVTLTDFADQDTRSWSTVPRGTQVCNGVTFVCDGAIRTAGLRSARDGKTYPGAVLDVPVRSRGTRIHLLQSSENSGGAIAGAPYGRMVLHYTNGESRRFDLLSSVHGRDWMHNPRNPDRPILDENTTVGWSQIHPRNGFLIRFHHITFTNPLPDVEITSADFLSPLHSANLLLFGLTVDNDARPLTAPWQPDDPEAIPPTDKIIVTLQDAAGRPLPAAFAWTAIAARGEVEFPPMRADAQGRVTLEFLRGALSQIRYTATAADGKTITGELQPNETGQFASNTVVQLNR